MFDMELLPLPAQPDWRAALWQSPWPAQRWVEGERWDCYCVCCVLLRGRGERGSALYHRRSELSELIRVQFMTQRAGSDKSALLAGRARDRAVVELKVDLEVDLAECWW